CLPASPGGGGAVPATAFERLAQSPRLVKPRNLLTQLAEWNRLGWLTRTDSEPTPSPRRRSSWTHPAAARLHGMGRAATPRAAPDLGRDGPAGCAAPWRHPRRRHKSRDGPERQGYQQQISDDTVHNAPELASSFIDQANMSTQDRLAAVTSRLQA